MITFSPLKPPTSYEKQIEILKKRGIIIDNNEFARIILERLNYYRLSAYCLPFKKGNDFFETGTSIEKIFMVYEFDRKLRNQLFSTIGPIEIFLRTKLAYYHAHKYNAEGYMNPDNFEDRIKHQIFLREFDVCVDHNEKSLFVDHHINKYGRRFPIWVAVEIFSFGMLSKFYANLIPADRKVIANTFKISEHHLKSWFTSITVLRNICAHYSRIYYNRFTQTPRLPKEGSFQQLSNLVFDIIYIMKYIYPDSKVWNNEIVINLMSIIEQYEGVIDLNHIGFPPDWQSLLMVKC